MFLLILLLLPVWRDSMHPGEGLWIWEYMNNVHQQEYYDSHIPYDEAVKKAHEAYECSRINRRQS